MRTLWMRPWFQAVAEGNGSPRRDETNPLFSVQALSYPMDYAAPNCSNSFRADVPGESFVSDITGSLGRMRE